MACRWQLLLRQLLWLPPGRVRLQLAVVRQQAWDGRHREVQIAKVWEFGQTELCAASLTDPIAALFSAAFWLHGGGAVGLRDPAHALEAAGESQAESADARLPQGGVRRGEGAR